MANRFWVGTTASHVGDWSWDDSGASFATSNWIDETGAKVAKPVSTDTVYLENSSQDVTSGFNQSTVVLTSLNIAQTYTGKIGDSSNYLKISATTYNQGLEGDTTNASGSGRIKIDFGSNQTTANVYQTGLASSDPGLEQLRILGTHGSNVLNLFSGTVGIGTTTSGEISTVATINVGTQDSSATLTLGRGLTLTTVNIGNGNVTNLGSNVSTVTLNGSNARYTVFRSATHTTLTVDKGICFYNSNGTITTANISGTLDLSGDPRGKTISTFNVYKGATVKLDNGVPLAFIFSTGIKLNRCGLKDISLDYGQNFTLTFS